MNATYDTAQSIGAATGQPDAAAIRRITPGEAVLLVEAGYATLIEARRPSDRRRRHVEGAMPVILDETAGAPGLSLLDEVPAYQLLILYCADPDASTVQDAATYLIRHGCDPGRLAVLIGDLEAWFGVGLPVIDS